MTREQALEAALRDALKHLGSAANYLHNLGLVFDFHMDAENAEKCAAIVHNAHEFGAIARSVLGRPTAAQKIEEEEKREEAINNGQFGVGA